MLNQNEPRGILYKKAAERNFQLFRYFPSKELAPFIECYWVVEWNLKGREPFISETLPHPSVHMVIEKEQSKIHGVMKHKFSYHLHNTGRVFGIKFRPGAFYPIYQKPISALTNQTIPLHTIFNVDVQALEREILLNKSHAESIQLTERLLRDQLPKQDMKVENIHSILSWIQGHKDIITVEAVASHFFLSKRTLQRLFHEYVGVSPKWVIQRYRLHEAAEQLAHGNVKDWTRLATEIGYYDQSHFIHDFKAIIGKTPQEYMKTSGSNEA